MSLRDDHIDKLPWPRLGDTLFKQRRVTGNHVPRFATDKQSDYIQGYKRAAEILVEQLASNEREDYLVYPIVFLWRQYIELRLKQIISLGVKLGESEVLPPLSHDIMKLWSTGKTIVEKVWPGGQKEDLESVESYLRQFAKVDPQSMAFRYSEDREGNPHLTGIQPVSVQSFAEVMERLGNFLDCVADGMHQYWLDIPREEMR